MGLGYKCFIALMIGLSYFNINRADINSLMWRFNGTMIKHNEEIRFSDFQAHTTLSWNNKTK